MNRKVFKLGISFTPQAVLYPFFLIGTLIFAQLVKAPISYMLFLLTALLPLVCAVHLIVITACLRVSFRVSQKSFSKCSSVRVNAVVANNSPIPMPFVEAVLTLPCKGETCCAPCKFAFSVMPFGAARIERNAEFIYIGKYHVGVRELQIYDFFRAVRLRVSVNQMSCVSVLPRIFDFPERNADFLISDRENSGRTGDFDVIGIREYRYGDNPRRIHWKLSSKNDETVVKEYIGGEGASSFILCDLQPPANISVNGVVTEGNELLQRACLDLVIEAALSAARRELLLSGCVVLAFMDNGEPTVLRIVSQTDLDSAAGRFVSVKSDASKGQLCMLTERQSIPQNASVTIVSAMLDSAHVDEFLTVINGRDRDARGDEYVFCRDMTAFPPDDNEQVEISKNRERLMLSGTAVISAADYIPQKQGKRLSRK